MALATWATVTGRNIDVKDVLPALMERAGELLNWAGGHGNRFTHDLFRFPGKFHPPLVERILHWAEPRAVIDPMGGVGTTSVEAKAMGIPSLSIDIDPVSVFFTRVKTTPLPEDVLVRARDILLASLTRYRRGVEEIEQRKFRDIRTDVMRRKLKRLGADDLERFIYWFRKYVLVDYARVEHSIFNGGLPRQSEQVRRFFWACLLSAIRRISLADPQPVSGLEITAHMREKLAAGYEIDVFKEFERRVDLGIKRMAQYHAYLQSSDSLDTSARVYQGDALSVATGRIAAKLKADLITFSPPYCNAIEYWRRHRLEYFLGGFLTEEEVVDIKRKFIGRTIVGARASPPDALGNPAIDGLIQALVGEGRVHKACLLWQYFTDMKERLQAFFDYLPKNGHCVIVVGDSTTAGTLVPTTNTLAWLGKEVGFLHLETSGYKIKNRVMQYPTRYNAKIEKESIIVLQKE